MSRRLLIFKTAVIIEGKPSINGVELGNYRGNVTYLPLQTRIEGTPIGWNNGDQITRKEAKNLIKKGSIKEILP